MQNLHWLRNRRDQGARYLPRTSRLEPYGPGIASGDAGGSVGSEVAVLVGTGAAVAVSEGVDVGGGESVGEGATIGSSAAPKVATVTRTLVPRLPIAHNEWIPSAVASGI